LSAPLELIVRVAGDADAAAVELCAPNVGVFTRALPEGAAVTPGASAGSLLLLGRAHELVVPAGIVGRVTSARPERVHAPVGYGDALYRIEPFSGAAADASALVARASGAGGASADTPGVRAPYAGRFWGRPTPTDPPFVAIGDVLTPGTVVGLIEVMKTFTQLRFEPTEGVSGDVRVARVLARDGDEVQIGDLLIEVS